eukprot:2633671-Prymnesium_polylepis.1
MGHRAFLRVRSINKFPQKHPERGHTPTRCAKFRTETGNADTRHTAHRTGTCTAGTGDKRQSTTQGERSRHVSLPTRTEPYHA